MNTEPTPIFRRDTVQQMALETLAKNLQLAREDLTAVMVERDELLAALRIARKMIPIDATPAYRLTLIDAVLNQFADLTPKDGADNITGAG